MQMNVDQVVVCDPWTTAPLGALLRIQPPGEKEPLIGMRTEIVPTGGAAHALLAIIDGAIAGRTLDGSVLGNRPALDLSALLDIKVDTAAALNNDYSQPPPIPGTRPRLGEAYHSAAHGVGMLSEVGGILGYVILSGAIVSAGGNRGRWTGLGPARYAGVISLAPK